MDAASRGRGRVGGRSNGRPPMTHSVALQAQSFLALALMYAGVRLRRRRRVHVPVMAVTIVFDLLIILQIEVARSAVDTAARAASNSAMLNVHVALSVLYVLLLGPVVFYGRRLLRGDGAARAVHRPLAAAAVALRTLVFATSFWAAEAAAG